MRFKEKMKKVNKYRTLADIRRIPKWARKRFGFTCDEVEFDYKLLTQFFRLDTIQIRQASFIPEIDLNAVTSFVDD